MIKLMRNAFDEQRPHGRITLFFLERVKSGEIRECPSGGKIPVLLYLYTPFNFIVWIPRLISVTSLRVYRSVKLWSNLNKNQ